MAVRVLHLSGMEDRPKFTSYKDAVGFTSTEGGTLLIHDEKNEYVVGYAPGRWLEVQIEDED